MAGISNIIEEFLMQELDEKDGLIEIGRNDLAHRFGCSPSQINYVLQTRFTPYKGYYTESKRGGLGYIKIIRLERVESKTIEDVLDELLGQDLTIDKAKNIIEVLKMEEILSEKEELIMLHAIDDRALQSVPQKLKAKVRREILYNMILAFARND